MSCYNLLGNRNNVLPYYIIREIKERLVMCCVKVARGFYDEDYLEINRSGFMIL